MDDDSFLERYEAYSRGRGFFGREPALGSSHLESGKLRELQTNQPYLWDLRSPWFLTTYPSPGMILQVLTFSHEKNPRDTSCTAMLCDLTDAGAKVPNLKKKNNTGPHSIGLVYLSKKIATHPQSTPQAIPLPNYERNPFIACW